MKCYQKSNSELLNPAPMITNGSTLDLPATKNGTNGHTVPNAHHDAIGDHIGLSIMRDRALSIGAILDIDSEPGEGTRISMKLPPVAL